MSQSTTDSVVLCLLVLVWKCVYMVVVVGCMCLCDWVVKLVKQCDGVSVVVVSVSVCASYILG
jgi:hypothetical protein